MRREHLVDSIEAKGYDRLLMKRLLEYLRPYRWWVALGVILLLLAAPMMLIGPFLVKVAIDQYIKEGDAGGLDRLAIFYLLISLLAFLVNYAQTYLTQWIGQRAMVDLRMKIFRHIQRLPLSHFDKTPVGALMTRVGSDVEVLQEMFSSGVITIFGDIFLLTGIVGVMLYMNLTLALITFAVIPILFWATLTFRKRVREAFRIIRQKVSALNAHLQETIVGMNIIQLFGQEEDNLDKYEKLGREHRDAFLRAILYYSIFFPAVEVIGALAVALIIFFGGGRIVQGTMTLGALVAFIQYTQHFFRPVQDLSEKYNILQSAMAASERIFQLLDTPTQEDRPGLEPPPEAARGAIEFKDVHFSYNPGEEILKGISFSVKPGEKVAIVGATGAGKTSIINLLSRLYDLEEGSISVDGTDIRDIPLPTLRRRVGIILQEIFLFSGNVVDNVRLDTEVSEEKVGEILSEIGARGMFEELPEGLNTPLRERASILSTGQKQLLAFARSLAYDPPILILDEATSSLDTDTERVIQEALERLMTGRTALIIAHRLSTVSRADRIIVMHHGRIREMGTHRELLRKKGFYYRLHQVQFNLQDRLPAAGA